jgi:hypothetical protein
MVAKAYNPKHTGGRDRRIVVQGWSRAGKTLSAKQNKAERGRHGAQVVEWLPNDMRP